MWNVWALLLLCCFIFENTHPKKIAHHSLDIYIFVYHIYIYIRINGRLDHGFLHVMPLWFFRGLFLGESSMDLKPRWIYRFLEGWGFGWGRSILPQIFFYIFAPIWGRFPIWLIFFRWVETTNQKTWAIYQKNTRQQKGEQIYKSPHIFGDLSTNKKIVQDSATSWNRLFFSFGNDFGHLFCFTKWNTKVFLRGLFILSAADARKNPGGRGGYQFLPLLADCFWLRAWGVAGLLNHWKVWKNGHTEKIWIKCDSGYGMCT